MVAETDLRDITAFRLDVLSDPRLPNRGPGRAGDGGFYLSNFSVAVAPLLKPQEAMPVTLSSAMADFSNHDAPAAASIDSEPKETSWCASQRPRQSHVAVFTTSADVGHPNGARLTFKLSHLQHGHQNLGRFRLSVTGAPRPVAVERPGVVLPLLLPDARTVFQDDPEFPEKLRDGAGKALLETADVGSGASAVRVNGQFRSTPWLQELVAQIREHPGPDEFRYLRFAWKKVEGRSIGLALAHDGNFKANGPRKFGYHAGPTPTPDGSLSIAAEAPRDWTVVTR